MKIENVSTKLDFDDVLIKPKRSTLSSRKEVDLNRRIEFLYSKHVFTGVPIMAANMDSVATIEAAKTFQKHGMFTCLSKFIPLQDIFAANLNQDQFAISIGGYLSLFDDVIGELMKNKDKFKYICVDVANGYSQEFSSFIKTVRFWFPEHVIIAGNVCTPEMTEELILSGADIVKIGIGPGSHCLTREKTGVGYPQLSAIIECADAAHGLGGRIIGDGGCRTPADVAKGFGGGADFIMVGSMFAAHDENSEPPDNRYVTGQSFVEVYGMSSTVAMKKHYGEVAEHRASEGRVTKLKRRGPLDDTIKDLLGSLRSTCTYIGARNLRDFSKCTTFILVNNQLSRLHETETIGE